MTLTLTETNSLLAKAGIDPIGLSIFNEMISSFKPKLLLAALKGASKDVGAKRWVLNNLSPLLENNQDQTTEKNAEAEYYLEQPLDQKPAIEAAPLPTEQINNEDHRSPSTHESSSPNSNDETREFKGHHVYGSSAALYFACTETRGGTPTLTIEGTNALAARKFDWPKKISLQITQAELPMVAAVLFGFVKSCEFKNHGAAKNKGFKMELQTNKTGQHIFLNLMEAKKAMVAVPISAEDVFYIRNLLIEQLMNNSPQLDSYSIISNIKAFARMKQPTNQ